MTYAEQGKVDNKHGFILELTLLSHFTENFCLIRNSDFTLCWLQTCT